LVFYQNSEIKLLCLKQKKVSQTKINSRKAGLTWVIKQGKIQEFTGPGAKKVLDKLVLNVVKVNKTSMVNGLPASPGKVVGRAFVVRDAKEAVRIIKPGGILVASMTMPNYLPAMKKAGAVVTDDGGIICHAAIVSRELGIPCIVGTKVATQIFKTGDKLEVDANKGVVRKI
jgi:pyruvate,water dikinase